jgi:diguanylate cyclase (GGDEF)-like protein
MLVTTLRDSSPPSASWSGAGQAPTPPHEIAAGRQRRIRRAWLQHYFDLISHLYVFLLLVGFCIVGYLPEAVLGAYGLWIGAWLAFISWAHASGWSLERRDPGLFVIHQGGSILGALGLLVAAPQVGPVALLMLILCSADGFMLSNRRTYALVWLLTMLATAVAMLYVGPLLRMPTDTLEGQLLCVGVVAGAVGRSLLLMQRFRRTQRELSIVQQKLGVAMAQIESLARSDELTGVANRRGIVETLERQWESVRRSRQPFCVVLIDLDNFRRVNEHYGHTMGDRVLRVFGGLLVAHTRAVDRVGRYGGEEFMLVLPDTALAQATEAMERLRQSIAATEWGTMTGTQLGVTATSGVAQCRPGESVESLIRRAEEALLRGKAAGRNQVATEQIA